MLCKFSHACTCTAGALAEEATSNCPCCWKHSEVPRKTPGSVLVFADSSPSLPHTQQDGKLPGHLPRSSEVAKSHLIGTGQQEPWSGAGSQSHRQGCSGGCVTAPLEGCVTQPLSSHSLSAARWAQIPLWGATNNFVSGKGRCMLPPALVSLAYGCYRVKTQH